jgi:hypothetical protein
MRLLLCRDKVDNLHDVFQDAREIQRRKKWAIGKLITFIKTMFFRKRYVVSGDDMAGASLGSLASPTRVVSDGSAKKGTSTRLF